jgi:hypothetical protein
MSLADPRSVSPDVVVGKYFGMNESCFIARATVGSFGAIGARTAINPFNHPTSWRSTNEFQISPQIVRLGVRIVPEAQASFCRRRHHPRRPPPANIRPGNPAPAMGPGTATGSAVMMRAKSPGDE